MKWVWMIWSLHLEVPRLDAEVTPLKFSYLPLPIELKSRYLLKLLYVVKSIVQVSYQMEPFLRPDNVNHDRADFG